MIERHVVIDRVLTHLRKNGETDLASQLDLATLKDKASIEFAWLIEAPGQRYLAVRKLGHSHSFHWTQEHLKAIRFHDRAQADLVMMAIRESEPELFAFARTLGDAQPVEHGWS